MNTLALKNQTNGPGPFLIRTPDGRQYKAPHGGFAGFAWFARRCMIIENEAGARLVNAARRVNPASSSGARHSLFF